MLLIGMMLNLRGDYEIYSNVESGYGRIDVGLFPRDIKRAAIIMELKVKRRGRGKSVKKILEEAVNQLRELEYISLAKKRGYRRIIAFGLVFDGKRCWIKEAEIS